MAKKYHPDLHPNDPEAEAKFKEVNEAASVLTDPDKRARYDQFGHAGVDNNGMGGGYSGGGFGDFGGFGGFGDIFDTFLAVVAVCPTNAIAQEEVLISKQLSPLHLKKLPSERKKK